MSPSTIRPRSELRKLGHFNPISPRSGTPDLAARRALWQRSHFDPREQLPKGSPNHGKPARRCSPIPALLSTDGAGR
ncbi:hypothetical protein HPP92_006617 [Vanilla planifolia]|uniref:Uncharacterized protein n=1 Tax=Vanilla planifolia TaxID=51239 RepID=A0A835R8N1_VANPL|nr:hypothetical protein HPP92_006617 [Vanilla planifolia]